MFKYIVVHVLKFYLFRFYEFTNYILTETHFWSSYEACVSAILFVDAITFEGA